MYSNYTRLLLRVTTTLTKYDGKVTFSDIVARSVPSFSTVGGRTFCDERKELYAIFDKGDFEGEKASSYYEANLEVIAEGNSETLALLKVYQLEMDFLAQKTGKVPDKITENQWRCLLTIDSKSKRADYLRSLWKREYLKIEKKRVQAEKREKFEEFTLNNPFEHVQLSTNAPMNYRLGRTTLFRRFYPPDLKKLSNFRLLQAMMFGPHIIVDGGYEKYMSVSEIVCCVKHIVTTWSTNRENFYPFDVIFCNLSTNSDIYSKLIREMPAIVEDPICPFNITDKNYLDLYPKEQLVYLTPNAPNYLEKYDHNSVYIIGGLVDTANKERLSLARAKKDGIRTAKFPFDKYFKWYAGKKIFTIPQCIGIMNDLKDGRDWKFASRHIPSWKLEQVNASPNHGNDSMEINVKTPKFFGKRYQKNKKLKTILDLIGNENYKPRRS